MFKSLNIIIIICTFFVLFFSCQKNTIEINGWSPEIITPLINSTITLANLIPEKGTTEYDDENLIHLAFRSDSIYVLNPDLMLDITGLNLDTVVTIEQLAINAQNDPSLAPLINLLGIEIPFPAEQEIPGALFSIINADIIDPFNFQFDEFSNANFNSGLLEIEITNNLPISIQSAVINILPGAESGIVWEVDIVDLSPSETAYKDIDLAGLVIENSNNVSIVIETLELENTGSDMVSITPYTGFEFSISVDNIGFDNITLPLGGDTVDIDLALFEDFDSGLILEDPRFTIQVDNPYGLSGNIDGFMLAYSQYGTQESLMVNLDIEPNTLSSITYYVDQIGSIIALPPQILEYEANASMSFNSNDIFGDSPLQLGVDIDFPLSVNAANLSLKDTVIFTSLNYNVNQVERILLHYNIVNGFPLGTEFNLVLHDSLTATNLDTLQFVDINDNSNNMIDAAFVNEFGEVTESALSSGFLILSDSEISHLLNTNKIIIDIKLSSSDFQDGDQYVKLYADYKCLLKVGLETEFSIY